MIRIITIEREYGSGGAAIGRALASRLGWKLWDQELTREIAHRVHADVHDVECREERCDPLFQRLVKTFLRGSFERSLPVSDTQILDAECMVDLMHDIIGEAAKEGNCIIVGRGAPYFLRGRDDTLHVFTYAIRDEKIRRVAESGKSVEEAADMVDTIDQERIHFIKKYFHADWPSRHLYHLMLNTGVGDDMVTDLILHTMEQLNQKVQS